MSNMNRNRQETLKQAARTHRDNLQKHLQRRMEMARANGDEQLLRQLEAEANYLN
jgi:plasmid maintenance system killer protein